MAILTWGEVEKRTYKTGVSKGILFAKDADGAYTGGVAWNGLTAVNETPSGAEENKFYADNIHYVSTYTNEEYGFTIEAYDSPVEFDVCDGTVVPVAGLELPQQKRRGFAFAFETNAGVGDDDRKGRIITIIYNAKAGVSEMAHSTVNESKDIQPLSWDCTTTPIEVAGYDPVSRVKINTLDLTPEKLTALEAKLYGTADTESSLPTIAEIMTLLAA